MRVRGITPILNVADVPESIRWFERLGWHPGFTWNAAGEIDDDALENDQSVATFGSAGAGAGDEGEGPTVFLCRDAQGMRDPDSEPDPDRDDCGAVWMSWWVDDVDAAHAECARLGVEIVRPPVNEPWGVREFLIRHMDGHCFRVSGATV